MQKTKRGELASQREVERTLQIATVESDPESVLVGIKNFPLHKLALICSERDTEAAEEAKGDIRDTLHIPVDIYTVDNDHVLEGVIETVFKIMKREGDDFDDVIVNIGREEEVIKCAALSSAFIHGLRAFHVSGDQPVPFPVLKLGYDEVIPSAKRHILQSLYSNGGEVRDLRELSEASGYTKSLLSYHINGTDGTKGLIDLGLVEVTKGKKSRSNVKLTTLGKLLLLDSDKNGE